MEGVSKKPLVEPLQPTAPAIIQRYFQVLKGYLLLHVHITFTSVVGCGA